MKKIILFLLIAHLSVSSFGQNLLPDEKKMQQIQGILLSVSGDPLQYPVVPLGKTGALSLDFDDLDGSIKAYSYTYQLCDADWQPVTTLSQFDYLSGYMQNRLTNYRVSSISKVRYVHYSVSLPEQACLPSKSGNYIIKIFLNGDTTQLAFQRRLLIVDDKVSAVAQVLQPFDSKKIRTSQKVQFTTDVSRLNVLNPQQQVKVVVLQNFRWDNAIKGLQPAFMRGSQYEYNGERDVVFPAGKEYRWLDLTSFRFLSDRIKSINMNAVPFDVDVLPDRERTNVDYLPYQDYDGFYYFKASEAIDVSMQGDYGKVRFHYYTKDNNELTGQNIYVVGQFNNYQCNEKSLLHYNEQTHTYENNQFLKQGYYTYMYVTKPENQMDAVPSTSLTEGNYWETENNYTILVYYRSLNNRYDELVGLTTVNSRTQNL